MGKISRDKNARIMLLQNDLSLYPNDLNNNRVKSYKGTQTATINYNPLKTLDKSDVFSLLFSCYKMLFLGERKTRKPRKLST